jgi:hypothetical protein
MMKNVGFSVEGFSDAMNSSEAPYFLEYERVEEIPT